jgi:hypothetical protein
MSHRGFARELQAAANHIDDIPGHELQTMLRRAAIRLDNIGGVAFADDVNEAVLTVAAELGQHRDDVVRIIIRQWLEQNGYLLANPLAGAGNAADQAN